MNTIAPAALVLGAMACLLVTMALLLFKRAKHKETEQSVLDNLQRGLDIKRDRQAAAFAPIMHGMPAPTTASHRMDGSIHTGLRRLQHALGYSAWGIGTKALTLGLVAGVALATLATLQGGAPLGALTLAVYFLLCVFAIWLRLSKRRARLLSQLPGFLDNMVRLITIGNSPHAAFQMANSHLPEPLGDALQQVSFSLSVSPDLGHAMEHLERTWNLPEFGLLAAVFRMSTRYGGRTDLVLDRVSTYIRDRQSAERELHALSAEVRLSAWILALLPIVVGTLIMLLNKGYFLRLWNDPVGQKMVLVAAALQVCGSFFLYRLARLK